MPELIRKIEPGDVIGRCRAIRELGRGGVGTVYLATHQTLRIDVALKVLSPALSLENPALAERFVLEAQLAARIRHPNVIAVMDAALDETTGLSYIVMEYVSGGSLSWHLRHGPIPEAKALAIVTGIAQALVVAEESQIVHRDIKPDNIMLDLRGTPKLADLGLAKHVIDSRTSLTLGGAFMGTPAYMSPEQARDAKVADTRDDIYSLGATFYECLTGVPPFVGETPYNIMSELLTKPSPRPRDVRPEVSRPVDIICRKMMAKSRHLRYANARALLEDLQICQTHGDAGFDRLDAASFDRDTVQASQQARAYGVETSADGVYVPEPPEDSEVGPIARRSAALIAPRRADYGVFGTAALLVALVMVATMALALIGPRNPLSFLGNENHMAPPAAPVVEVTTKPKLSKETASTETPKKHTPKKTETPKPAVVQADQPPVDLPPPVTTNDTTVAIRAQPVVPPPDNPLLLPPPDMTNAVPAIPVTQEELAASQVDPAMAAMSESAFAARVIAENSLDAGMTAATGHASLLKIIGRRDPKQISPSVWTFYFYDKDAPGHARIVTVGDGKVIKNRVDLEHFAWAYAEQNILADDTSLIDSTQALDISEGLIPGVTVTGSELILDQPKNSKPNWRITLWSRNGDDGDRKLGDVNIVAETGYVLKSNLKP